MLVSLISLTLLLGAQQPATTPPQPPPATPPAAPRAPQPRRPATPPPATARATVEVQVATESGTPIQGLLITAQGPIYRSGRSDAQGKLTLSGLTVGTYRLRAEGDEVVTLEKEVVVKPGAPISVDFAMAAAPPPPAPPPPPPPPPPAMPELKPGDPKTAFLPELAEKSLSGRDPIRTVALGCSGMSRSDLLVVREGTGSTSNAEVDQTFYLIAGEATLTLAGKEQAMTAGWFGLVPRGSTYTLARKGRNPAIVLAVVSGIPCPSAK